MGDPPPALPMIVLPDVVVRLNAGRRSSDALCRCWFSRAPPALCVDGRLSRFRMRLAIMCCLRAGLWVLLSRRPQYQCLLPCPLLVAKSLARLG